MTACFLDICPPLLVVSTTYGVCPVGEGSPTAGSAFCAGGDLLLTQSPHENCDTRDHVRRVSADRSDAQHHEHETEDRQPSVAGLGDEVRDQHQRASTQQGSHDTEDERAELVQDGHAASLFLV